MGRSITKTPKRADQLASLPRLLPRLAVCSLPAFSRHYTTTTVAADHRRYRPSILQTIPLFTPPYIALNADSSSSHVLNPPHNCYIFH